MPAHQLFGQVGLPGKAVVVVTRLLGEPEAKEVEGEDPLARQQLNQLAPVVGAGREAVQEQQQWSLSRLVEAVDPLTAELLGMAAPPPRLDSVGQLGAASRHDRPKR